ncbi:MAG: hypothetical protein K2L02_05255, partial [Clostridia bacterium]|nr:hypothetical protein [Clostridia bacterium]
LQFSDGKPLTINDVMFNIYEYLDPVYTGSSTMYSTKIQGLAKYRTQQNLSSSEINSAQDQDTKNAETKARARRRELVNVYKQDRFHVGGGSGNSYSAPYDQMKDAISKWNVSAGYKDAVLIKDPATSLKKENPTEEDYRAKLLEDYELVRETFEKELNSDFNASLESYDLESDTSPYKKWASKFEGTKGEAFRFFLFEGYITPKYGKGADGKDDKNNIESFDKETILDSNDTKDKAIDYIFNDKIEDDLESVLSYWGTAGDILTQFTAEAKEIILNNRRDGGELAYSHVDGIVSLGHKVKGESDYPLGSETAVTINGTSYTIAREHNQDGTPKNADTYDVLQITLDGKDPKAIFNFAFSVAPAHYYTADSDHPNGRTINIENDEFGVEYASASFQGKVIQSEQHVSVPVGAGPYKATNSSNEDNPAGNEFWRNNYVYYKANHNFIFDVKTEKVQYQYVSSANALDKLAAKEIDFVSPQLTQKNSQRLKDMKADGFESIAAWQLGYGYVGINAGKVENINLRRAIMSAMQASLATEYYETGTCKVIDWPMSRESWAYPEGESGAADRPYLQWNGKEEAKDKIRSYTNAAGNGAKLNYKFTIAGSSITEHPTYSVFKQAAELLNECGWNVEVKADSQALTKLATGSLEVWAAAWGSTIDPDMYQVYHKNSTATSVYAWGYREILSNTTLYSEEAGIISQLSELIDDGRMTTDEEERKGIYKNAMGLVLDLAVEMPIYQRQNVYAYNSKKIVGGLSADVNPYTSPLEKIWEIEVK